MNTWVAPEGGLPHLAGVSNGGLSAFRVAALNSERFASILVFPGYPSSDEDSEALADLIEVPIRMFVGESDAGWVMPMEETATALDGLGGDVELVVVGGEGHIIAALSDGVRLFDELDALR